VNPEKKKRRWKKHLDGQNTSSDSEDEEEKKNDFEVKFQGSGAHASGSLQYAQNNATATLEIDTSHDQVMFIFNNLFVLAFLLICNFKCIKYR